MGKVNKILIAIFILGVLMSGAIIYLKMGKCPQSPAEKFLLSPQEAAQKAITYINQNLLQKGMTASFLNVAEENDIYKFHIKIGDQEYNSYVTKDGKLLFPEGINLETQPEKLPPTPKTTQTIGNFLVSKEEICRENEKPIIYFFGSKRCHHCVWEGPIVEKVAKDFEGYISFHNNIDSERDREVFRKYSTGGIPTLVFGCKYYRVGSGEREGEELESKNLTALICRLTDNQPSEACDRVKDLIDQIGE
jgi:thiol-disulfide isomerase/thioredoxin